MSTSTLQTPPKQPAVNLISKAKRARPLFDPPIVKLAIWDSFVKLSPATFWKNPVMFVVEIGAMLTTLPLARDVVTRVGNQDTDYFQSRRDISRPHDCAGRGLATTEDAE